MKHVPTLDRTAAVVAAPVPLHTTWGLGYGCDELTSFPERRYEASSVSPGCGVAPEKNVSVCPLSV